ncbi:hypothetical protein SAMN05216553_106198 [Lentzea fradiae]|uniref:MftR C-terminal domain-containing protein n=1 Tax=Lentzea fradiae TaxID=200378 RepID=A0A1G7SE36_9PSEU|nr:hypothetical protein [Lentzea fradiae]SDG21152.1 hypothetical protein SAMN05216553_106198 [Lentzea fradiae]
MTPALRERELAKHDGLIEVVVRGLRDRGVPDGLAVLAARTGWAACHHAVPRWLAEPSTGLDAHLLQAFEDLRTLSR